MRVFGLLISLLALAAAVMGSIAFGVTNIPLHQVWESFTHFNGSNEHLIILTARLPRALIAVAVGACLAVAGALMQVITRNPIASPSTLGVNSGAAFFIILASGWLRRRWRWRCCIFRRRKRASKRQIRGARVMCH